MVILLVSLAFPVCFLCALFYFGGKYEEHKRVVNLLLELMGKVLARNELVAARFLEDLRVLIENGGKW